VKGMLGGYDSISDLDVKGSYNFIYQFLNSYTEESLAIDVGAGIGRVTKEFLVKVFTKVDLLEQNPRFVSEGKKHLANTIHIGEYFCDSLQKFTFTKKYDGIWVQWVIIYLTDEDFIQFFSKCKNSLTKKGLIFVKDNVTRSGFDLDTRDSSVTRSDAHLKLLFEACGLTIVKEEQQLDFPEELFPVKIYALK